MTGTVNEMYLSELHAHDPGEGQKSLARFSNEEEEDELGTTIAVVTDPTGGIVEASDEFIPELGMPSKKLNKLRSRRSEIQENRDVDDIEAHNMAIAEEDIPEFYKEYLRSGSASEKVDELVERVENGEKITLICFEKQPKWCHRHLLKEEIENRVES